MPNRYLPFDVTKNIVYGKFDKKVFDAKTVSSLYIIGAIRPVGQVFFEENDNGSLDSVQEWVSVARS